VKNADQLMGKNDCKRIETDAYQLMGKKKKTRQRMTENVISTKWVLQQGKSLDATTVLQ